MYMEQDEGQDRLDHMREQAAHRALQLTKFEALEPQRLRLRLKPALWCENVALLCSGWCLPLKDNDASRLQRNDSFGGQQSVLLGPIASALEEYV